MLYTASKNIPDSLKSVEETQPEERQPDGRKRKPSQLETGDNSNTGKPASAPSKKAKTTELEEPPRSTSARAQRQKPASATSHQEPVSATLRQKSASTNRHQKPASATLRQNLTSASASATPVASIQNPVAAPSYANKNSKKRISLTDDAFPEDPKTPAPPLKKPRVNRNDTAHDSEGNSKKPQARAKPLRRSGNVSFDLKCHLC
jgi:hypothetical protein